MTGGRGRFLTSWLVFGFAFLYAPIVILIAFSFNDQKSVATWAGFSLRWYQSLAGNDAILAAAWTSLRIGVVNASAAVVLGTLAAIALVRMGRFPGRTLFGGLVSAPLVMPEVIIGLSLLLLFAAMESLLGWPDGRGLTTITIAHITFSSAYATVVVQSRLAVMDRSLEEAAMDLGCPPVKTFLVITLPIIAPALVSAWLLAFTLSVDDLVISTFTAGPTSTTLPMQVFAMARRGVSPEINALATIIVAVVGTGIFAAALLGRRAEARRQREMQDAVREAKAAA